MAFMNEATGTWSEVEVAGHRCRLFEPAAPSPHGYVVIYLHCSRAASLRGYPAFVREFERHGLRVIEPVTGQSWWTDRIWPEFDPDISAEAYVSIMSCRMLPSAGTRGRRGWRSWASAWAARARCGWRTNIRTCFPPWPPSRRPIDFQKRIEEGVDPGLEFMYRDAEDARQDTATLHIHPLNWPRNQFFCCDPTDVRWHESADRLRMKLWSLGVPFECDLETEAGGHSFEYASPHGRARGRVPGKAAGAGAIAGV